MNNILNTRSICPICKKEIPSTIELTDKVMMRKNCSEHGDFEGLVEKRSDIYMLLKRQPRLDNIPDMTFLDITNECNLVNME